MATRKRWGLQEEEEEKEEEEEGAVSLVAWCCMSDKSQNRSIQPPGGQ